MIHENRDIQISMSINEVLLEHSPLIYMLAYVFMLQGRVE